MRKFKFRKLKRWLKKIYHFFVGGEGQSQPQPFEHVYDVRDIFFQENVPTGFKRYDMIVRLLAIENYYGKNNYGWKLYEKMQSAHLGKGEEKAAIERFKKLIQSYEEKGYDENSAIELDNRLMILDGSHRMALAFYHRHYLIKAMVQPYEQNVDVSKTSFSFIKIGFTKEEEKHIFQRYQQLVEETIRPFVVTLWKPIIEHYDEITYHLSKFGEIVNVRDVNLSDYNYGSLMLKIYSCDDGTQEGIHQKILCQKNYHPNTLRFVYINISSPKYRIKGKTLNPISQTCERLKRNIRLSYKKNIENYHEIHDSIIHIGDNYTQNIFIHDLVESYDKVPVKEIFDAISKYEYVLTKMEVPYMTDDFPITYPLGKDADILCSEKDIKNISEIILNILHKQPYNWRVKYIENSPLSLYIYIYLGDQFIYGFDVNAEYLSKEFVNSAIEHRIQKGNIYVSDNAHEMVVRLFEYNKSNYKKHHLEWLYNNLPNIARKNVLQYLGEAQSILLQSVCGGLESDGNESHKGENTI